MQADRCWGPHAPGDGSLGSTGAGALTLVNRGLLIVDATGGIQPGPGSMPIINLGTMEVAAGSTLSCPQAKLRQPDRTAVLRVNGLLDQDLVIIEAGPLRESARIVFAIISLEGAAAPGSSLGVQTGAVQNSSPLNEPQHPRV